MPLLEDDTAIERVLRSARSIAVVGISDKLYRDSHSVARYLMTAGYTIYPVNPLLSSVLDVRCYPNLESIGAPVDIVDIFRRPDRVLAVVDDAIAAGFQTFWFQLGVAHPEATAKALTHGARVVLNRCIMVEHQRLAR